MKELWLAGHVHVCLRDGESIWLDVQQNRYFALSSQDTSRLASVVNAWITEVDGDTIGPIDSRTKTIAERLLARGALSQIQAKRRGFVVQQASPLHRLTSDSNDVVAKIRWHHVFRFVRACVTMFALLKLGSLAKALAAVETETELQRVWTSKDFELAQSIVSIHEQLRLYLYDEKQACLLDSLILMRFLSAYRLRPKLIIGVTMRPFRAHSWVQEGSYVFNSEVASAAEYTPILVI